MSAYGLLLMQLMHPRAHALFLHAACPDAIRQMPGIKGVGSAGGMSSTLAASKLAVA